MRTVADGTGSYAVLVSDEEGIKRACVVLPPEFKPGYLENYNFVTFSVLIGSWYDMARRLSLRKALEAEENFAVL